MSFGYCGSLSNPVSANLRVDSTGIRCTLQSDASFSIADNKARLVTFILVVPKHVGFVEIDWVGKYDSDDSPDVDFVGWVDSNGVLNSASYTSAAVTTQVTDLPTVDVMYGVSDIAIAAITGNTSTLFNKFTIKYNLANNTGSSISCQRLLTGFSYNKTNLPQTNSTQFSIFASINIGPEAATLTNS
jgi:hypothetical protein